MQYPGSVCPIVARALAAVTLLAGALAAHGADTYGPAALELQIPTLGIGSATFSRVVLTFEWPPVRDPAGTYPVGTADAYDPATRHLIVPAVTVGSETLYNVVVTVNQLTSIGSVQGADTFDGTSLVLRNVQIDGGPIYHDVTLHVGIANLERISMGMPSVSIDQYDTATGQLTIAAVQVGGKVYTNVVLNVGLANVAGVVGYAIGVLHNFQSGTDGAGPLGVMSIDKAGNLYGTASMAGSGNLGAVFKFSPNGSGGFNYTSIGLSAPACPLGGGPHAGVIVDAAGNLYGVANGGCTDNGVVYKLTPNGSGGYSESLVYSFLGGADGYNPQTGLVMDAAGNLYGTTEYGGSGAGVGTVFKLTPDSNSSTGYTKTVLYSFQAAADGEEPTGGLSMDAFGNLYTTSVGGGSTNHGVVDQFVPNPDGSGTYTANVIYTFQGTPDGVNPYDGVLVDAFGNLYGTTADGGEFGYGLVFELTPNRNPDGSVTFTESRLYSFQGNPNELANGDGGNPQGGLIMDAGGSLYGTTVLGGGPGFGVAFRLTPNGAGGYTESILCDFERGTNIFDPAYGLVMDASGNLYGAAEGGSEEFGAVIEIH